MFDVAEAERARAAATTLPARVDAPGEGAEGAAKWDDVALAGGDVSGCSSSRAVAFPPECAGSSTRMVDLFGTTTSLLVGVGTEPAPGTSGTAGGSFALACEGLEYAVWEVGVGTRRCAFRFVGGAGEGELVPCLGGYGCC